MARFDFMACEGLNVIGRMPAADKPTVLIVGARMCSEYGRYMARVYGQHFGAAGWQLITEMSLGVSGIAARAAIREGADVFAVMGCGADVCYPPENMDLYESIKKQGGIISQYADGTKPERTLFDKRHELLVGLADHVIVMEARRKSSTLRIAGLAREQGKLLYALPGRATDRLSDGTNELIQKGGAIMTVQPDDILNDYRHIVFSNELPFN